MDLKDCERTARSVAPHRSGPNTLTAAVSKSSQWGRVLLFEVTDLVRMQFKVANFFFFFFATFNKALIELLGIKEAKRSGDIAGWAAAVN